MFSSLSVDLTGFRRPAHARCISDAAREIRDQARSNTTDDVRSLAWDAWCMRTPAAAFLRPASRSLVAASHGFVVDNSTVWGRPAGVAVTRDGALLVSDDGNGIIFRVTSEGSR